MRWLGWVVAGMLFCPGAPLSETLSPEALMGEGQALTRGGDHVQARGRYHDAASAYREAGDRQGRVQALSAEAMTLHRLGHLGDAQAILAEALAVEGVTREERALLLREQGEALIAQRRYDQAGAHLEESLALAESGEAWDTLGVLGFYQGEDQAALMAFTKARTLAKAGSLEGVKAGLHLARLHRETGRKADGDKVLHSLVAPWAALPESEDKALMGIALATLSRDLGGGKGGEGERLRLLDGARATAAAVGSRRGLSLALGETGRLYEAQGGYGEALRLTQEAIFYAQELQAPDLLYPWEWQNGRLLAAQGARHEAMVSYRQAIEHLETVRQAVIRQPARGDTSFRERVGGVYLGLADLLLRHAEEVQEAERQSSLQEAQGVLERLKAAELEDYFKDECVEMARSGQKRVEEVAAGVALLYPVLLPDRTVMLVGLPGGLRQVVIPIPGEEINQEATVLRFNLEKRTSRAYLPQAQHLYDQLIRPLAAALTGIDTLVVVPDGGLRQIPWAALHDGAGFLVERYAVSVTPGLRLTDPQPILREGARMLLNGLTESVQGFPALPFAGEEMQRIEGLYPGRELRNVDFSLANLEHELEKSPYAIVHIASHGQFTGDVSNTFLLSYDDHITMDRLDRLVRRSGEREEPVELLTLSACQTAKGDERAALGLAGVAIKAGARSALASLWYVSDQASAELVTGFYHHLQDPHLTKAHALRQAQMALLKDRRYRHPAYWAPFLLIGNWL